MYCLYLRVSTKESETLLLHNLSGSSLILILTVSIWAVVRGYWYLRSPFGRELADIDTSSLHLSGSSQILILMVSIWGVVRGYWYLLSPFGQELANIDNSGLHLSGSFADIDTYDLHLRGSSRILILTVSIWAVVRGYWRWTPSALCPCPLTCHCWECSRLTPRYVFPLPQTAQKCQDWSAFLVLKQNFKITIIQNYF